MLRIAVAEALAEGADLDALHCPSMIAREVQAMSLNFWRIRLYSEGA